MKRRLVILAGLAVVLALLWSCMVPVDETEFVIVTQFGRPVGEPLHDAGLHWKAPYQSTRRFDRRLRVFNPPAPEFLTKDIRNVIVDVCMFWRVSDALLFLKAHSSVLAAENALTTDLRHRLMTEIGRNSLTALVSVNEGDVKIPEIVGRVREGCRDRAGKEWGIEVVDVKLKRLDVPQQSKPAVFERMRAERRRVARKLRAEGEEQALRIRAEADRQATEIRSQAYAEAERIKGDGDAQAIRIYAQALDKDPEFYKLVRTLDAYKKFLNEKTTVILSSDSDLLKLLTQGRAGSDAGSPAGRPQAK
ncbi:MAG: protease modulator HflC [Planctomycetes bacterium]|nr:protease modulator HflC [Planctomycetota bacterium]MBM4078911.1 protease modulator HflC [Planctomycetota bacterium]MBM4083219.1 protease modulator HflC [Planctomycetota bacterium]